MPFSNDIAMAQAEKATRERFGILRGLLALAVLAYVALFIAVEHAQAPNEATFEPQVSGARVLAGYVDVLDVDPVREEMHVRLDFATGTGPAGTKYYGPADRDAVVTVADGYTESDVRIRRNATMPSTPFTVSLRGAIRRYPFDRYGARLSVSAVEPRSGRAIPVRLTLWKGVPDWDVNVSRPAANLDPRATEAAIVIARPGPQVFFACALEAITIVIAVTGIVLGRLAFIGAYRREKVPIGVLVGMVFALPAVRSVLPGAPPLGVFADILVFLWAELTVVVSLALSVAAWARPEADAASD